MSGLDKMVSGILEEATILAKRKIELAAEEVAKIDLVAKEELAQKVDEINRKSMAEIGEERQRSASSSDRFRRKALLLGKQEIIAVTLEKAYQNIMNLEVRDYFAFLAKILKKHAWAEKGEIYFSAADLARMPGDFGMELDQIAKEKGGSLELMATPKEIDSGFILVYGGIEENCSLSAMMRAEQEKLSDLINKILFE